VSNLDDLDALRAQVRRLTALVDDMRDRFDDQTSPAIASTLQPVFADVNGWVTGRLIPLLERQPGGQLRWCASWWAHPEARSRFEACWRAWETLRMEPTTGMSVWYRDHLDPMLTAVMSANGPFAACTLDRHMPPAPLPIAEEPADARTS
jgi:hypothetical protein